ncbi:FAD-dependent monooxygenase [Streptomyces iconiensis]|uniref:FAD-dependent monooxygenase n=1 Tax=Streptomyces iconiensis TaxID=1384038 RepID=A0ABT7A1E0_9ACTN|nr:FAD-dependent monooxygenase [Streptomyces iconiensis]MDJ1135158.1 FAD-dependent monooxygenase [Streptomyces iconiensis]
MARRQRHGQDPPRTHPLRQHHGNHPPTPAPLTPRGTRVRTGRHRPARALDPRTPGHRNRVDQDSSAPPTRLPCAQPPPPGSTTLAHRANHRFLRPPCPKALIPPYPSVPEHDLCGWGRWPSPLLDGGALSDVLVVGAGATGMTPANELRVAGVSAVLVDKLPQRSELSKDGGVQCRTQEAFDQRGRP